MINEPSKLVKIKNDNDIMENKYTLKQFSRNISILYNVSIYAQTNSEKKIISTKAQEITNLKQTHYSNPKYAFPL